MAGLSESKTKFGWFRLRYNEETETTSDTRNILLIVATLITAVTFQAGVNPPGGVWQEGIDAGKAIYSDQPVPFTVFLVSNTLALSSSIMVLISLTYKFPFYLDLWGAILAMFATYASAVFAVSPGEVQFRYLWATAAVPFGFRILLKVLKMWTKQRKDSSTAQDS